MSNGKFLFTILLALLCCLSVLAGDNAADTAKFSYIPEVHGVARIRWAQSLSTGEGHFQVPNARISLDGKVAPILSYKFNLGVCEYGKVKILDVYARVTPVTGLSIQAGQFRMPFGTDCFRGPATYIFNNRSFMAKYMANVRGVGLKAGYTLSKIPLTMEGAVFNPTEMSDHTSWVKTYAYAAKASFRPDGFKFETGFMSLRPENVRINLVGASAGWHNSSLNIEAEYMRKHYTNSACRPANSFNVFAQWLLPVKVGMFNHWAMEGRFDSMSAHSNGKADANGELTINQPTRSRATIGSTLSYTYRKIRADIRLDYEKYFFGHGGRPDDSHGDRISLELVFAF